MQTLKQCVHFHGVGSLGAAVNLATLYAAHDLFGVWVYAAMVISFTTANFTSFVAVKKWTFKETCWSPSLVFKQWSRFFSIAVTGLGLNVVAFGLLHGYLGMGIYPSQCMALVSIAPVHYFLNRAFTFPSALDPDPEVGPAN